MYETWDEIKKSESEEDIDEEKKSLSCLMALSNEVTNFHSKLVVTLISLI